MIPQLKKKKLLMKQSIEFQNNGIDVMAVARLEKYLIVAHKSEETKVLKFLQKKELIEQKKEIERLNKEVEQIEMETEKSKEKL